MRILGRSLLGSHLDVGRLHVLLGLGGADFLVGFRVGFLAVARAVGHALARDAGFEQRRLLRVGFWLGAFGAGWWGG